MVRNVLLTRIGAWGLALAVPASASAGPLSEAARKATEGRELAVAQSQSEQNTRGRGRFWTNIALIAGGGVLAVLGGFEISDSAGTDDDADTDDAAGADDGDRAAKFMLGGGIAAAGVGAILLARGGRMANPAISTRPGRLTVRHTIRF